MNVSLLCHLHLLDGKAFGYEANLGVAHIVYKRRVNAYLALHLATAICWRNHNPWHICLCCPLFVGAHDHSVLATCSLGIDGCCVSLEAIY